MKRESAFAVGCSIRKLVAENSGLRAARSLSDTIGPPENSVAPKSRLSLNKCSTFSNFAYSCSFPKARRFLEMTHPGAMTGFILFISGILFRSIQAAVSPHRSNGTWV